MKKRKRILNHNSKNLQSEMFGQFSSDHHDIDIRAWHGFLTQKLWLDFPFFTNRNRVKNYLPASLIIEAAQEDE